MGELYRKAHGSEKGLGDIILAAYDRTAGLIEERKVEPIPVELVGRTMLETSLAGIMLGDMVSYYLAALKGVDPAPVASITELKKRMK